MITLITYLWDRPSIEEIVIDYYAHLRDSVERTLVLVAAYSEETQASTVERAQAKGWRVVKCPKEPLSDKLNAAMLSIRNIPCSHVVTFGSDDLIHRDAFETLCQAGEEHECAGFVGAYILNPETREAAHFVEPPGKRRRPCGAGRILSREVLERLEWVLRPDGLRNNLDKALDDRLRNIGMWWHLIDKDMSAPVVDVKVGRNLSSFDLLLDAGATLVEWDDVVRAFGEPWVGRLEGI